MMMAPTTTARTATLALYRSCLRSVQRIPDVDHRMEYKIYVRQGFRDKARLNEGSSYATAALEDAREQLERMDYYHSIREQKQSTKQIKPPTTAAVNSMASSTNVMDTRQTNSAIVHQWLQKALPELSDDDKSHYTAQLLEDGFDSFELLSNEILPDEDLSFMKKAHRRAIVRFYFRET